MSYINPDWIENIHIERVLAKQDFVIDDFQMRCDTEIELQCSIQGVKASDIPTDGITGYTNSPILIQYGIDYLTYLIARGLREPEDDNDVYDGIADIYYKAFMDTRGYITKDTILNVDKEELPKTSFITSAPIF